jgi:hypothetical protein
MRKAFSKKQSTTAIDIVLQVAGNQVEARLGFGELKLVE